MGAEETKPPQESPENNQDQDVGADEVVPKKAYDEVTQDMFKYKQKMRELEQNLKSYEEQIKTAENKKLEQKEEYKTLYEQHKQEAERLRQEKQELLKSVEDDKKYEQIKRAALKAGIRDEALDDLDLIDASDVIVERTDQGRLNIIGHEEFVTRLKERKPFWFKETSAPRVNSVTGGAGIKDNTISRSDLLKMQKERPDEYKKAFAEIKAGKKKLV